MLRKSSDGNFIAMAVALCIVVWAYLSGPENSEAQAHHDHYCEMVQIYTESDGRYGWPDYENRECSND